MSELYLQLDVPPVLTGAPIPTTVNLRLTDLETQVGLTGSPDPLTVENRLTVAQADIITAQDTADTHIADLANPHVVTAAQVGLGNCDNTADVDKPVSTLQAAAISSAQAAAIAGAPVQSVAGRTGDIVLAATDVFGLGTAATKDTGTASGNVVTLDGAAKLPAVDGSQLTNLPGGGVTDHGALTGLADDDHAQYHTDARGDARYSVLAHNHAGVYEASGATATHSALTSAVHGITVFGASLVDDASAADARTTLGLGAAASLNVGTVAGTVAAGDDARIVAAAPETTSTIGTLIAGSADKATPVDADSLAISDSAAAGILKRLSWANVKAGLNSIYARLAGAAGGQTITGGTAAGENLTLQSTSNATKGAIIFGTASKYDHANDRLGLGTLTPTAKMHALATTEQLRLGYDASNYYSITVGSGGVVTHSATGTQVGFKTTTTTATLGSELLSNGGFSGDLASWTDSGASWSWSAGVALHTAGSASTLSQNVSVTSGSTYQIVFTVGSRTAGSVSVSLGAVAVPNVGSGTTFTSNGTYTRTVVAGASGSVSLTITPSSDFAGNVDAVSCKLVTLGSIPSPIAIVDSGGSLALDFRVSATSLGIGRESIQSLTSGLQNTALGSQAQRLLTTGSANVALGWRAQYWMDNGGQNTAVGHQAMYLLTSGSDNTAVGYSSSYGITLGQNNVTVGSLSGHGITTGSQNTVCGVSSLRNITTQSGNTAIGYFSGRYLADGSSPLTDCANSVYVGASTKGTAAATNENVFGYNAIGIGSNSCVIGSSAVTKCQIYGDIILDKTVTAAGTTGAQTINKTCGSVNFRAGDTSLVVTDSRVTTASVIVANVATNDATMKTVVVVAAAGSFTIHANAAATAETRVNFIVIN